MISAPVRQRSYPAGSMDGLSEDFSGLPDYKTRSERQAERRDRKFAEHRVNPHRGRRTRIAIVGAFVISLILAAVLLVIAYAPAPFIGVSASALSKSVGTANGTSCHPNTGGWICTLGERGESARYQISSDWAGCWAGKRIGGPGKASQPKEISGCVSLLNHLTSG